jgi:hypothetical protein
MPVLTGQTTDVTKSAVFGNNEATGTANPPGGSGVFGLTVAPKAAGVFGANNNPTSGRGVQGNGTEAGVGGFSDKGFGMLAQSNTGSGIVATSVNGQGMTAYSDNDTAFFAQGGSFAGVFNGAVVVSPGPNPKDTTKVPSNINGSIVITDGNLYVNRGDVILGGADCAEEFDTIGINASDTGTVMVIDEEGPLKSSDRPYDRKVAGIISGAGTYKTGIVLDRQNQEVKNTNRFPIALIGKVYCKVDAQYGSIQIGDLLTTSATVGHAMKASDPLAAFGAVLGKALRPLASGRGLIPVLVTLQ